MCKGIIRLPIGSSVSPHERELTSTRPSFELTYLLNLSSRRVPLRLRHLHASYGDQLLEQGKHLKCGQVLWEDWELRLDAFMG